MKECGRGPHGACAGGRRPAGREGAGQGRGPRGRQGGPGEWRRGVGCCPEAELNGSLLSHRVSSPPSPTRSLRRSDAVPRGKSHGRVPAVFAGGLVYRLSAARAAAPGRPRRPRQAPRLRRPYSWAPPVCPAPAPFCSRAVLILGSGVLGTTRSLRRADPRASVRWCWGSAGSATLLAARLCADRSGATLVLAFRALQEKGWGCRPISWVPCLGRGRRYSVAPRAKRGQQGPRAADPRPAAGAASAVAGAPGGRNVLSS